MSQSSKRKNKHYTLKGKEGKKSTWDTLHKHFPTLGITGNLYENVDVPEDMFTEVYEAIKESGIDEDAARKEARIESLNEWVAANTVDFFNELNLLYGVVRDEYHENYHGSDQGFPDGFRYKAQTGDAKNGPAYMELTFSWIEDQIENPHIFPEQDLDKFPDNFIEEYIHNIYKKMVRIFAIMYSRCYKTFTKSSADNHLNTCFKHFFYFTERFQLLGGNERELEVFASPAVKSIVKLDQLKKKYEADKQEYLKAVKEAGK